MRAPKSFHLNLESNKVCLGRGDAICGECNCHDGFRGKYCEKTSKEKEKFCHKMIECAVTNEFFEGSSKPEECRSMPEDYFWTNVHKVCLLPDRGKTNNFLKSYSGAKLRINKALCMI